MNLLIKKAKIIDPNSNFNNKVKDILIKNGKIVKIADNISEKIQTIEEKDLHISIGWFDM